MEPIWRVRIQYYSMAILVMLITITLHKYIIPGTFIIPFIGAVLVMMIFGTFLNVLNRIVKNDGSFKTDRELEEEE